MLDLLFTERFSPKNGVTESELWSVLVEKNLVAQKALPVSATSTPWYIQFMQSIAAWVASLFILAFTISFFSLFFDDLDTLFATLVGLLYSGVAIYIYRAAPKQLFLNQMALALSLCGLLSLGYGMTGWFVDDFGASWFLGFGAVLLLNWFLVEHYSHQYIMSFGMLACFIGLGYELHLLELMPVIISIMFVTLWLTHAKTAQHFARMSALGYMLGLWLVLIQLPLLASQTSLALQDDVRLIASWSNPLAVMVTLILAVVLIINICRSLSVSPSSKQGVIAIIAMVVLAISAIAMTGLLSAVLILIVGFYVGERRLFALGGIGILSFIAWYYYSLQATLLDKSIWLLALGLVLLLAKLLMAKILIAKY
ncbi:DUF4401 domain-containing protein [Shewanella sp. 125m-7]